MLKWALIIGLTCLACGSSVTVKTTVPVGRTQVPVEVTVVSPVRPTPVARKPAEGFEPRQYTIFFPFDSAVIQPDQMITLTDAAAGAQGLSQEIVVSGYCDERGSDAYNYRLGLRRAESVGRALNDLGFSFVTLYSAGESGRIAVGHNEEAWAQNRRVEFTVR